VVQAIGVRRPLVLLALASAAAAASAAGCAFESQLVVRATGAGPVVVVQSVAPEVTLRRVDGVTRRSGQVVGIDCTTTIVYDVREATGLAVLAQSFLVRLRTRRLPRGTPYSFDCAGPLVLELPADASDIAATATPATPLDILDPLTSIPLAFGRRLRAEPGTRLDLIQWRGDLPAGDYRVELSFSLPDAQPFRERAIGTASIRCGRARYLQPILPAVTRITQAPAFTIAPSSAETTLVLPRIVGGIGTFRQATRTLSCRP
jgi:hypothetical protein